MAESDVHLTCKECGSGFVWSLAQQKDYARRGFVNQPARCPACRTKAREQRETLGKEIICADCGKKAKVMFDIKKDQSVFCEKCFEKLRQKSQI